MTKEVMGDAFGPGAREPSPQDAVSALRASPPIALERLVAAQAAAITELSAALAGMLDEFGGYVIPAVDAAITAMQNLGKDRWSLQAHFAQGIEARSAETAGLDPKGESPVAREGDAP